jgi:bifunctional UDP-N-acetylglucosamine pyrophosphorylase/glucosamine-1-phosphate N-acetyltransferase
VAAIQLDAIVLAAGRSRRFKGASPKVLHPLCGRPLIAHILETLKDVRPKRVCLVVPPGKAVESALKDKKYPFEIVFAVQKEPGGTGHAAQIGLRKLGSSGDVLVLAGDAPLVRAESLKQLVAARRDAVAAAAILTAVFDDPPAYGRILRTEGTITGVVEARDATPAQLAIKEINTSTYSFDANALAKALPKLKTDNAQGERYLTDVIGLLVDAGETLTSVEGHADEVLGTNTRAELARVMAIKRAEIVQNLMDDGVTIIDPDTTYVDVGVKVGADTVLHPNVFLYDETTVGAGCSIGPFAVLRSTKVGDGADVGPFASLRPGTVIAKGAHVGTFAEMKNAKIGEGSKVPHFSYLGDVTVGRGSNIAAGTITSNYDGKDKHPTKIGDDVFIGSDTILVAPVNVGRGAYTGAGSVVTRDVPAGGLVYGVPASKRERTTKKKPKKKK